MNVVCAWCKRHLHGDPKDRVVSHGICPPCEKKHFPELQGARARFVGYVEYEPTQWHAEFEVTGHNTLPDKSQVNWDTLNRLHIPIPAFPDCYSWRREQFLARVTSWKFVREFFNPK